MKPPHFLVFARPRSRTAWLANFLSTSGTFCLHEPLAEAATLEELDRALQRPFRFGADVHRIGIADTSLIHAPERALEAFPGALVLFLLSDGKAWHRFARRHGFPAELVELVDQAYDRAAARLVGRAHFFEAVDLTESGIVARAVWSHASGGKAFPNERWRMLRRLNVQVDADDLAARIRRMVSG